MANEFARNLVDAGYTTTFTLPASASSSTNQATPFDFGADTHKPEQVEIEISVPALTTTIVPDTRTVTLIIETSTVVGFGTIDQTICSEVATGAGGVGISATAKRVRLPSNCARYVRGKITFGASTTTGAAFSATCRALF